MRLQNKNKKQKKYSVLQFLLFIKIFGEVHKEDANVGKNLQQKNIHFFNIP